MTVAVTGTPGTGKTAAVTVLADRFDLECIHLNTVIQTEGFYHRDDPDRDTVVADLEAVVDWLADHHADVIESHLAHYLPADRVAVLRCRPDVLERRLLERGESAEMARENAESEALDLILTEAVERHGRDSVYEIDTTDRSIEGVAETIHAVVTGSRDPSAGTVDFTEYLDDVG